MESVIAAKCEVKGEPGGDKCEKYKERSAVVMTHTATVYAGMAVRFGMN
jgi:hypothetical protein